MALQSLVQKGDRDQLVEKLEGQSSNKDLLDRGNQGHTPLELAAVLGREELVGVLLDHGAEVNSGNKSGRNISCLLVVGPYCYSL